MQDGSAFAGVSRPGIRTFPLEQPYVGRSFLPGDPGRVPKIAAFLDDAVEGAHNREYRIFTGTLFGNGSGNALRRI